MSQCIYLLPHDVKSLSHQRLIVCEGYSDAVFVCKLLEFNKITNCSVGCPSERGGHGSGDGAITSYLRGVRGLLNQGKANLTHLLVVTDADGDATIKFKKMVNALGKATMHQPSKAFHLEGAPIATGVFIIPGDGRNGTLEHLLWEAAIQKTPSLKRSVALFCWTTGGHINSAPPNKKAKMQMSAIVAAKCKVNPWASSATFWSDPGCPVEISSSCFEHVSQFLRDFAA